MTVRRDCNEKGEKSIRSYRFARVPWRNETRSFAAASAKQENQRTTDLDGRILSTKLNRASPRAVVSHGDSGRPVEAGNGGRRDFAHNIATSSHKSPRAARVTAGAGRKRNVTGTGSINILLALLAAVLFVVATNSNVSQRFSYHYRGRRTARRFHP